MINKRIPLCIIVLAFATTFQLQPTSVHNKTKLQDTRQEKMPRHHVTRPDNNEHRAHVHRSEARV